MSRRESLGSPQPPSSLPHRQFPDFDVMAQREHWDATTRGVVESRLEAPDPDLFFTAAERATAAALCDQLLDQHEEPRVPVVEMVEERLATGNADGWRHRDLPSDPEAWRQSLHCVDEDARQSCGAAFADCSLDQQHDVLARIQAWPDDSWHHLRPAEIWNLWMRYVCAAFYSHPWAWNEIGFPGPAYPRGYKNLGLDRREAFEQSKRYPDRDEVE